MLVSIIIPSYNHSRYIEECLGSVGCQTYRAIELIIVDDGSTDESVETINNFLDKNRELKAQFFSQKNQGISAALNKGIKESRGDAILVLASDDTLLPNAIETMLPYLQGEVGVVFGDALVADELGTELSVPLKNNIKTSSFLKWRLNGLPPGLFDLSRPRKMLLNRNFIPPGSLISRKVFSKVGEYNQHVKLEDHEMWLRVSRHFAFAYCSEIVSKYRIHGKNTFLTAGKRLFEDTIDIFIEEKNKCKNSDQAFLIDLRLILLLLSYLKNYGCGPKAFRKFVIWVKKIIFRNINN